MIADGLARGGPPRPARDRRLPRRRRGRARRPRPRRPRAGGSARLSEAPTTPTAPRRAHRRPTVLEITDLSAGYDNVPVVRGLSMTVARRRGRRADGRRTAPARRRRCARSPGWSRCIVRDDQRSTAPTSPACRRRRAPGRHRARSRGPRDLLRPHRSPSTSASACVRAASSSTRCSTHFPALRRCRTAAPASSPAASSRCSRSRAR